jgi:hypothetical protein
MPEIELSVVVTAGHYSDGISSIHCASRSIDLEPVFRLKFATAAFLPALADPYAFIYKKELLDADPRCYGLRIGCFDIVLWIPMVARQITVRPKGIHLGGRHWPRWATSLSGPISRFEKQIMGSGPFRFKEYQALRRKLVPPIDAGLGTAPYP